MNICVFGLWHLGTVTAACLASSGRQVIGLDFDAQVIDALNKDRAPLFEPGLEELLHAGLSAGHLRFTTDAHNALAEADVVWVTYDTPVDDEDRADTAFVIERVQGLFPDIAAGALVLLSSQLPVGSVADLERRYTDRHPDKPVSFACTPENLRLGQAIAAFTTPERVVVGVRDDRDKPRLAELFRPYTARIEWMAVESAEMTKHALNAFLATSVAFANEIATLCEQVGADARAVARGLKSDIRIGPRAYLAPGAAFAGGTQARDIAFLGANGAAHNVPTHLLSAVRVSNEAHKLWTRKQLQALLGDLAGRRVAVWGLAYKPGTDTLRRSEAVALCRWLLAQGALVSAHDPVVTTLPADLSDKIDLTGTALGALADAEALVVATPWPDFQAVSVDAMLTTMAEPNIVDPNRFLKQCRDQPALHYVSVGNADRTTPEIIQL